MKSKTTAAPMDALNRSAFKRPRIALWLGGLLLGTFILAALIGPALTPHSPLGLDLDNPLASPSAAHLLGTDENGTDLLSMLLHGARLALLISGITVAGSLILGTTLGALAGYRGGLLDEIVMRTVDVLLSFPGILLNLAIVALVNRPGTGFLIIALMANGWVGYARVARAQAIAVRERDYVMAAKTMGASDFHVLIRHVIPTIAAPLIVQATFGFGGVILVEASLSFLGLGPAVPYSWGALLSQGTAYLWRSAHLATVPGVAIAVVVLGANLLGDALRDFLDPRTQHRQ